MKTEMQNREQDMKRRKNGSGRRGVALIVVLGFLSILIVMAVAFLTQARVERQVSDSTLEAMRGRQLLRTALHAAMNDYSVELAKAGLVMAPTNSAYDMFTSLPPKPLFGLGGRTIDKDNVSLLIGEVSDWIPRKYTNAPYFATSAVPKEAQWILVREDPSSPQPSRILGRYAYVCFDMSGGADANLIARDSNIGAGDSRVASNRIRRSIRQMPMGMLPEAANPGQFKSYRQGWKGFDSLCALIRLTDGYPNDGNAGSDTRWQVERKEGAAPAGLASNLVSDLVPFSLSVFRGGRYTPASATWTTPTFCGNVGSWASTLNPISGQFAGNWSTWIDNAIHDFTSSAPLPIGVNYPSPKNVPMFNEINASYRLLPPVQDPVNLTWYAYTLEVRLTFEFWYPFPSADNVTNLVFQMPVPTLGGGAAASGNAQIWFQMVMPTVSPPLIGFGTIPSPSPLTVEARYNNGRPYLATGTTNFVFQIPLTRTPPPSPAPPDINYPFPNNTSPVLLNTITLTQPIYLTGAGGNADMIPNGLVISPTPVTLIPGNPAPAARVLEVTDPRLNHLPGQWVLQAVPTPAAMNTWNAAAKAKFQAEGTNLYCRNKPMETPADLGYISTGNEWETIDICTPAAADVMANLIADTNLYATYASNNVVYTNGTINPNGRSSNVLASAFYDLATHEVPNEPITYAGANPIDGATAQLLAQSILASTVTGTVSTACQAGSDWVRCAAMQKGGALAATLNNNQRESLVRNTWGLFSPDNSLFTVVVVAQAIKEAPASADPIGVWNENADTVTGERRAVALIWRDPFKNGNNLHHEMMIRMFRYLND